MPTINYVQAAHAQATVGTGTTITTPGITTSAGNLAVAITIRNTATTGTTTSNSDSKANTWSTAVADTRTTGATDNTPGTTAALRYAKLTSAGSSHTFTDTSTNAAFLTIEVVELNGQHPTAPLDKTAIGFNSVGSSNPHNLASITPALTNTMVVYGGSSDGSGSETWTATGTGTTRAEDDSTSNQPGSVATDFRSTTGAIVEGFNLTANNSVAWVAVGANFLSDPTAPAPPSAGLQPGGFHPGKGPTRSRFYQSRARSTDIVIAPATTAPYLAQPPQIINQTLKRGSTR